MSINSIKVKRVVRPLDLGDYQDEYKDTIVEVWVNPPLKISREVGKLLQKWQKASLKRVLLEKPADPDEISEEKLPEGVPEQGYERILTGSDEEIASAREKELEAKLAYYDWFAQVWEDSAEEDVRALVEKLEAEEPALLIFLRDRTLRMISDYAKARKKA